MEVTSSKLGCHGQQTLSEVVGWVSMKMSIQHYELQHEYGHGPLKKLGTFVLFHKSCYFSN